MNRSLLAIVGAAVTVLSCGGGTGASQPGPSHAPDSAVAIGTARLPGLLGRAGPAERDLLRDGTLTIAEYEQAAFGYLACLRDYGVTPERQPKRSAGGSYVFSFTYSAAEAPEAGAALVRCEAEHWAVINEVWGLAHPVPETVLQSARDALGGCLKEAGMPDVPAHPGDGELLRLLDRDQARWLAPFLNCSERVGDEYGLPFFGG